VRLLEIILLFVFSFLPPLIYAVWIRNTERYNREKWWPIIFCFLWGATIAIVASIILELILGISLAENLEDLSYLGISSAVIIAPFAEELIKPLALRSKTVKKELTELEDGLIYGAVAGLGFSATENLFYGNSFLEEGLVIFIVLISIRSFGGCLLHASATSLTGYGYGKAIIKNKSVIRVFPYLLIAMIMHALYNFLVTFDFLIGPTLGLIFALIFVGLSIRYIRNKIRKLDSANPD
jgi:RsiW-degrading membrane proteinase PrsW (M82 family)